MTDSMTANTTDARFKELLWRAILIPFVLMLGIAGVLVFQINHLMATGAAVEHSDFTLSKANHLEKMIIDMETGLRGYMVTGVPDFLEPYNNSRFAVESECRSLSDLVSADPAQKQVAEDITSRWKTWVAYSERLIELRPRDPDAARSVMETRLGKNQMDAIRAQFRTFDSTEERIRDVRSETSRKASQLILWIAGATAVVGGAILSWLARRQFLDLSRTYDAALLQVSDLNANLERRVEQRTSELAEANRELEAFSYSVSHDLRAPMRHVSGFSDLLRKSLGSRLTADESENLATIHDTARLAGRMVDDLLAFSRVGRTELRISEVDMGALVEQCRRDLKLEMTGRQIEWRIAPLPPAQGDPALLKLVMQNLLSNAVKYTNQSPAAVIEVASAPGNGGTDYLVRDNGIGFNPDYASKLFGVFQRLHRSEEFEGTGIGLANVRRIIVRHGGRVWASGKLNEGATFSFFLPAVPPAIYRGKRDDSDQAHSPG